jgi:hypothetical protein
MRPCRHALLVYLSAKPWLHRTQFRHGFVSRGEQLVGGVSQLLSLRGWRCRAGRQDGFHLAHCSSVNQQLLLAVRSPIAVGRLVPALVSMSGSEFGTAAREQVEVQHSMLLGCQVTAAASIILTQQPSLL